mmetsp:Transcript_13784/g.17992  ORF Transcript_13784/g.17992 Transcript_13784/m.17992 type:complete len:145 (-) Transcript_13784:66-500(-)
MAHQDSDVEVRNSDTNVNYIDNNGVPSNEVDTLSIDDEDALEGKYPDNDLEGSDNDDDQASYGFDDTAEEGYSSDEYNDEDNHLPHGETKDDAGDDSVFQGDKNSKSDYDSESDISVGDIVDQGFMEVHSFSAKPWQKLATSLV